LLLELKVSPTNKILKQIGIKISFAYI